MTAVDAHRGDDAAQIAPVEEEDAAARVMQDIDLLACILQPLPPRDLVSACGASPQMRKAVMDVVVFPRIKAALETAKKWKSEVKKKSPQMGRVQYLLQVESAAEVAPTEYKDKAANRRSTLGQFLDHVRVEAGMRGKLDDFEPRVHAIEVQFDKRRTPDDEVFRLYDECKALEDEIFLPHEQGLATGAGNLATIVSTSAQTGGPPGSMTVNIGGHMITGDAEEISAQIAALMPSTTAAHGAIRRATIPSIGATVIVPPPPPPPPPSAPSSSAAAAPSPPSIIEQSAADVDVDTLGVKALKKLITSAGLSTKDCVEKADLRKRAKEAQAAKRNRN